MPRITVNQFIQSSLRMLGLLAFADEIRFYLDKSRNKKANNEFREKNSNLSFPEDRLIYEIFGTVDYYNFFDSGKNAAKSIKEIALKYKKGNIGSILEWGCGVARITRHMPEYFKNAKIHGCDINQQMIDWCCSEITNSSYKINSIAPPLPYDNEFFDLVYSTSVLTHISEKFQKLWIDEIMRILKKGGIFIFTTQGNYFASKKLSVEEKLKYDNGEFIIRDKVDEGSRIMAVFHSEKYVKTNLLAGKNILAKIEGEEYEIAGMQDIWIIEK